ncbi:MAG: hypothetical protein ACRC92_21080 [Peptostreptococcaceae bacterium]
MKKIIIGCLLTTIGAFSNIALFISLSFHINELGSWSNPPGKLSSVMQNTGASILIIPIIIATIFIIVGLYFLFSSEENKI